MTQNKNARLQLERNIDTIAKNFCAELTAVINAIYSKSSKDVDVMTLHDKFIVVKRENPKGLLEKTGPYLWKYREQIANENTEFFLNNTFEDDITGSPEDFSVLLNKCKQIWHSLQLMEKSVIIKHIRVAVSAYAKYLSYSKELLQLNN